MAVACDSGLCCAGGAVRSAFSCTESSRAGNGVTSQAPLVVETVGSTGFDFGWLFSIGFILSSSRGCGVCGNAEIEPCARHK